MTHHNDEHIVANEVALLDYLYEEGDPGDRLKVARHLQECTPCSVAVLELQSVRGLLSEWTPPAANLGFKVVKNDEPVATPSPPAWKRLGLRSGWPAWMQAAAAVLFFVAGMGMSQLTVEYGNGAITVRSRNAVPAPVDTPAVAHAGTDILLTPVGLNSQREVATTKGAAESNAADEMLRRVKDLIDQSETRQQRELALRLSDVVHDFDVQRQADMQRVDQNLGQLEGQTGAEVARQRELLNSLVKVSQGGDR